MATQIHCRDIVATQCKGKDRAVPGMPRLAATVQHDHRAAARIARKINAERQSLVSGDVSGMNELLLQMLAKTARRSQGIAGCTITFPRASELAVSSVVPAGSPFACSRNATMST